MSTIEKALASIARDLDELGRPWALVGALALAARAEARATLDMDVVVAVRDREDLSRLVESLRERGYRWQRDLGDSMTSLEAPTESSSGLRLDLLFALSRIEGEVARRAETLEVLPGLELPVARLGDLIALKLLGAGELEREHDWRDLRALQRSAGASDLELARSSVADLCRRNPDQADTLEANLERFLAGVSQEQRTPATCCPR